MRASATVVRRAPQLEARAAPSVRFGRPTTRFSRRRVPGARLKLGGHAPPGLSRSVEAVGKVLKLFETVEETIEIYEREGRPLPSAMPGRKFVNALQELA